MKEIILWIGTILGMITFIIVVNLMINFLPKLIDEFCIVECASMTDKLIELGELANFTYNQTEWNKFYDMCRKTCLKRLTWW